jgi:hypothetical protein
MDLLTQAVAQEAMPDLTADEVAALPRLITNASRAIERYCKRGLATASYDERHRPGRDRLIRLKAPPIASISRICTGLTTVLSVVNGDAATTRAGVLLSPATLTLYRSAPGSPSVVPIDLTTCETIAALAAAVNAVGGGWSAIIGGNWGGWLTADLDPLAGVQNAKGRPCSLLAMTRDLSYNVVDPDIGTVEIFESRPEAYRLPDRAYAWGGNAAWSQADPRHADVRAIYIGGYDIAAMPGDIVEAAILTIRAAFDSRKVSGVIKSETVGNTGYTTSDAGSGSIIPATAKGLLGPWRPRSL